MEIEDDLNNFEIRGLGNVKKCNVNPIAINQDVIAYGKIEMDKLDLETVNVNQRARQNRYKKMSAAVVRNTKSFQMVMIINKVSLLFV